MNRILDLLKTGSQKTSVPNIVLWTIFLLVFIYYGRGIQGIAQTAVEPTKEEKEERAEERKEMRRLIEVLSKLEGRLGTLETLYAERFANYTLRLNNVESDVKDLERKVDNQHNPKR